MYQFFPLAVRVALVIASISASTAAVAEPLSAENLLRLKEIGGYTGSLAVSPDGSLVAFQVQQADFAARTYKVGWYAAPTTGGAPKFLGEGGDLMLSILPDGQINGARADVTAKWSPNGEWIAYLRKTDGQVQVWRSRVDGSIQEQVTHGDADVLRFDWTPSGDGLWFTVGRNRAQMARSDEEEGDRGYLLDERFAPDYSLKPLWHACGATFSDVSAPLSQNCTPSVWRVDFGNTERLLEDKREIDAFEKETMPAHPPRVDATRRIKNVVWNNLKRRVAWFENELPHQNPGFAAPLTLYADDTRCVAAECVGQLKGAWWNADEIVFLRKEGHAFSIPALYAWSPGDAHVRLIKRFDGSLESCGMGQGKLICLQETPQEPRRITAIDLNDKVSTTIFDPNPDFTRFAVGAVERLEWYDAFGNPTFGHLVFPPDYQKEKRYPLVVVQYRSRGFLKGGVGEEYPIYPLAAAGFLVLSFERPEDWRASARYTTSTLAERADSEGREWKDAYERRRSLTALEIILDKLVARGVLDPERIGITGLSDGAETVSFAMFNSTRFAAAAQSGDSTRIYYDLAVNDSYRAYYRRLFRARSGKEVVEKWKRLSLMDRAQKVTTPLLIQVSDSELILTTPLFVALKDAGKPVEAYVFPNEFHIKWQPQHKLVIAERTIEWFRFWLNGELDDDPAKAAQYSRWCKMREQQGPDHRLSSRCNEATMERPAR